jgi:hypothetical protein
LKSAKLAVKDVAVSDMNEELGLYQFIVTFHDQSKARAFFRKDGDWKLTNVNRLLNVPCPICRKDYYCKCYEKNSAEIERQLVDGDLLDSTLAARSAQ